MASSSKKPRNKPPTSRPTSTSQISQPVTAEGASALVSLSSFSPNGDLFAFVSLAVDKHRLQVFDANSARSVAEHTVESSRVTTLAWSNIDLSEGQRQSAEFISPQPAKKKRRKSESQVPGTETTTLQVVLLGLSNGEMLLFSPTHGRVLRTLSHPSSRSAIACVVTTHRNAAVWTSGADGIIRHWDAQKNILLGIWKIDDRTPYSAMALRPGLTHEDDDEPLELLCANHAIHLLSVLPDPAVASLGIQKPQKLASFTGHASSVKDLHWDSSQSLASRFFSMAEGDRFVSVWEVPILKTGSIKEGKMVASISLDSDVLNISLSGSHTSGPPAPKQCLLTQSASGKLSVFPIPAELTQPTNSQKTQHKLPTLLPRSNISLTFKTNSPSAQVASASFLEHRGRIQVARIVGGVRPVFDIIQYIDEDGAFIQDVNVVTEDTAARRGDQAQMLPQNNRYTESSALTFRSGVELGQEEDMEDLPSKNLDGDLDVDLAELSLGQRLAAFSVPDDTFGHTATSGGSESEDHSQPLEASAKRRRDKPFDVPANSLTRTLIQALHSSDSRLLEMCLMHSDQSLIRNTVRRLPPQLAVPLIVGCVERLGRGARGSNMKGRGGGASSQRGTALMGWITVVLAVHSGHLMTMPDLVARLSVLHATLNTRLTLHECLLSLCGRLDMVLSQVEMRSAAPASVNSHPGTGHPNKEVMRYVEGESEDDMAVEVEKDSGDEAGSIEDVELGGDSPDDESGEESEGSEEEEEDSEDEGPTMNGFIDDEAEEYSGDEDEDDDSE